MTNKLRIIFLGTPDFAVGVLNALVDHKYNLLGVVTAPDRPAGRGRNLQPSAVKNAALKHNLKLWQPESLKDPNFLKELEGLNPDVFVVVAFRMLPEVLWKIPSQGTFNLHASLLPQYRGAAPINWAIINGEKNTGVTTFFIDHQIDTGAIIQSKSCPIEPNENASELHDKLMALGTQLVLNTIDAINQGEAKPKPQKPHSPLKSAPKLNQNNTRIDWNWPAEKILNLIRGLDAYPGAWTTLVHKGESLKVKIYQAQYTNRNATLAPGSICTDKKMLFIHASDYQLSINALQLPGKKKMPAESLLNGFSFEKEDKFV
jgi:methionyl-tRNA formyltransferase